MRGKVFGEGVRTVHELYKFRALIRALVVRHLQARYRGSILGFLWSFLNPLCLMGVYLLVFQFFINNSVENYPLYLFTGLLPWIWFTSGLSEGVSSIVQSGHLITKSMFPAHILPAVAVMSAGIHFLLTVPLILMCMVVFHVPIGASILALPCIVVGQLLFLYGLSLALSTLNVHLRDVQHIVANVLSLVFFLCPIVYPARQIPERFSFLIDYNPVAQLVSFYHVAFLGGAAPPFAHIAFFAASTIGAVCLGVVIYSRSRENFAELL